MKRLVALLAVLAATAGCASTVTGRGTVAANLSGSSATTGASPASPSASDPASTQPSSPTPRSSSASTATTQWLRVTDAPTGFTFRLPSQPRLQRRTVVADDGTSLKARTYTAAEVVTDLDASVTVEGSAGNQLMTWRLDDLPRRMRTRFDTAGSTDFAILEKHHRTVDGHAAISFRIRFTSLDGSRRHSVWFLCAVATSRALVLVQTVGFASTDDESSALRTERKVQSQIVTSLALGSS